MFVLMIVIEAEVEQDRASIGNVPSNYSESVCVPEFDEKFLNHGK